MGFQSRVMSGINAYVIIGIFMGIATLFILTLTFMHMLKESSNTKRPKDLDL